MFLVLSCSCLCPIHWSQALSQEWRCSWSSADRRCSNYIWVINNFVAYEGAAYFRGLMLGRLLNADVCSELNVLGTLVQFRSAGRKQRCQSKGCSQIDLAMKWSTWFDFWNKNWLKQNLRSILNTFMKTECPNMHCWKSFFKLSVNCRYGSMHVQTPGSCWLRADSSFMPSQWETALLCNKVS